MGEAKRRGTTEQRIADAKETKIRRQNTPVDIIKKEFGLPMNSKFLGCVVQLRESDEYLAIFEENQIMTKRGFVPSPEGAIRYATRQEADKVAERLGKGAFSGVLFDTGDQYFVAFDG